MDFLIKISIILSLIILHGCSSFSNVQKVLNGSKEEEFSKLNFVGEEFIINFNGRFQILKKIETQNLKIDVWKLLDNSIANSIDGKIIKTIKKRKIEKYR